jgi:hypothetical protein
VPCLIGYQGATALGQPLLLMLPSGMAVLQKMVPDRLASSKARAVRRMPRPLPALFRYFLHDKREPDPQHIPSSLVPDVNGHLRHARHEPLRHSRYRR